MAKTASEPHANDYDLFCGFSSEVLYHQPSRGAENSLRRKTQTLVTLSQNSSEEPDFERGGVWGTP